MGRGEAIQLFPERFRAAKADGERIRPGGKKKYRRDMIMRGDMPPWNSPAATCALAAGGGKAQWQTTGNRETQSYGGYSNPYWHFR